MYSVPRFICRRNGEHFRQKTIEEMETKINVININGIDYLTVQQFATICGKGNSQIYKLIQQEIIKADFLMNQRMIPVTELKKKDILFPPKFKHTENHHGERVQ